MLDTGIQTEIVAYGMLLYEVLKHGASKDSHSLKSCVMEPHSSALYLLTR